MRQLDGTDLREAPFLVVLVVEVAAVGYSLVAPQHWLRAVAVMAIGLFAGGLFRALLSNDQAGLLRVRRKSFDVACYWVLAAAAILLAVALPQR